MHLEKLERNAYLLQINDQQIELEAQDLLDLFDHLREGARLDNLRQEARAAAQLQAREKPWLPGLEDERQGRPS